jgi:RNA polymerase sigma-70 factor (ECF subfamily)
MSPTLTMTTTSALLSGLRENDNSRAWEQFDARYRPLILAYAQRLGLDAEHAADVAQESLLCFIRDYRDGKYQRERGRLRSWIIGIVKHRALDALRGRARRRGERGESVIDTLADNAWLESEWEQERRQLLLRRALAELRETSRTADRTIQAFEQLVLNGRTVNDVAAALGMTPSDVYTAKNRVAERLRDILSQLDALYDDHVER